MFQKRYVVGVFVLLLVLSVAFAAPAMAQLSRCTDNGSVIAYGDTVSGEVTDKAPGVIFCFEGRAGDEVTITLSATGGNLDTLVALGSPGFEELYGQNDDADSSTTNSALNITLETSGEYTILATRYNLDDGSTSGSFTLTLEVENPAPSKVPPGGTVSAFTCPTWTPEVAIGDTETGTIDDEDYIAAYCYIGMAGDQIIISAAATSGNLDTLIFITDEEIEEVFADNDDLDNSTTNSEVTFDIPEDGIYLISVTRYNLEDGSSSGNFTMEVGGKAVSRSTDSGSSVSNGITMNDCEATPLSDLIQGEWQSTDDNGEVQLAMNFSCGGKMSLTFADATEAYAYTFDGDTIVITGDELELVLTEVLVSEVLFMAMLQTDDDESLIVLLNAEAETAD